MESLDQKPLRFRNSRFACSAIMVLLCVSLLALWARSYEHFDDLSFGFGGRCCGILPSSRGRLHWNEIFRINDGESSDHSLHFDQCSLRLYSISGGLPAKAGIGTSVPDWLLIAIFGGLVAAPWLRFQFSLRTLFALTTLVAMVLGLISISS